MTPPSPSTAPLAGLDAPQHAPRTAAVVLGSGGARGYAHIGALDAIAARGLEVVAVSGTSMGALIGGLFASGGLEDYREWVLGLGWADVMRLVDLSPLSSMGAIRGDKLFATVGDMIGDVLIESLPIPFTAVATDLLSQREVWFQDGSLADAVRASIAIPSLFSPVVTDNQLLVDGALLTPIPIPPTLSAKADITIAVSLAGGTRRMVPTRPSGPLFTADDPDEDPDGDSTAAITDDPGDGDSDGAVERPIDVLRERVSRMLDIDALRARIGRIGDGDRHAERAETADLGRFDVMNLAYETMEAALTSYKLAGYPPDVMVEIPKSSARTFEFHRAAELIELGRTQTDAALDLVGLTID